MGNFSGVEEITNCGTTMHTGTMDTDFTINMNQFETTRSKCGVCALVLIHF